MKLEPNRTSLSSAPVVPTKRYAWEGLSVSQTLTANPPCVSCGAADVVHIVEGSYEPNAEQTREHLVTPDIQYLKSLAECTVRNRAQGWKPLTFQGRPAMQRFICRPCLIGKQQMHHEHKRKVSEELKGSMQGDSYYLAVCGE